MEDEIFLQPTDEARDLIHDFLGLPTLLGQEVDILHAPEHIFDGHFWRGVEPDIVGVVPDQLERQGQVTELSGVHFSDP
jgi:hypothetical protein